MTMGMVTEDVKRIGIANKKIWRLKPTRCLELYRQMKQGDDIQEEKLHYTSRGLEAEILDRFDNQRYRLTLEPIKE